MKTNDRLELVKVLLGGAVLVLLTIAYAVLAYTGRDRQGLLGVIGVAWGTPSVVAEVGPGDLQAHKSPTGCPAEALEVCMKVTRVFGP
ncbi:MAG TPA: hypothetical protein VGR92_03565 [Steroidobacteraceae bacterium]|nr:hypothetical protein [Steroidobacteraceae bacterium]